MLLVYVLLSTAVMNTLNVSDIKTNTFVKDFPMVLQGLGKIKGDPVRVELQDSCQPFNLSTPRHFVLPSLKPLKDELDRMEKMEVIRKIDKPTTWCFSAQCWSFMQCYPGNFLTHSWHQLCNFVMLTSKSLTSLRKLAGTAVKNYGILGYEKRAV